MANQIRGFNTLARWEASEKRDSLLLKASAEYLQKTYKQTNKQTNNRKSNLSTESFTNYNLKKYDEISTNSNTYTTNDDDDDDNNNDNNANNNSY